MMARDFIIDKCSICLFTRLLAIFASSKFTPTGMPQKRTESAFKRTQKFKKSAIYYPDFGVFLPPRNSETLINSHFQFLNIRKFS